MALPSRQAVAGFTLMELVIAVVIVGILAAIAVPSYSRYIARANRTAAQQTLLDLASQQEQFRIRSRRYATAAELMGNATGFSVDRRGARTTVTAEQIYAITMTTTGGYTLTATATGSQATRDAECATFSLSATGARTATNTSCWGD